MSDFETRLREVLDERSALAPEPHGLVDGARRRLRRRRTTWAVAAAAVVAAAVPVGLGQRGPDGTAGVADDPVATTGLPPGVMEWGYRAESWHDLTFEVPVEWGYGGATAWCTVGETPAEALPLVTRPDTVTPAIACSPASGYGATIGSGATLDPVYDSGHVWQFRSGGGTDAPLYPHDAWLGYWYDADTVVTVVTPDQELTRRIVDSVERFEKTDPNGCASTLGESQAAQGGDGYDSLTLCRYDADDQLTASRRLIGSDTQPAETQILSSPLRQEDIDCPAEPDLSHTVLISQGGYVATAVVDAACEGLNGLFMSGTVRDLTDSAERHLDLTRLP